MSHARTARPAALLASLVLLPASLVIRASRAPYPHRLPSMYRVHRVSLDIRAQLPAVCHVCPRMSFPHSQAGKHRKTA